MEKLDYSDPRKLYEKVSSLPEAELREVVLTYLSARGKGEATQLPAIMPAGVGRKSPTLADRFSFTKKLLDLLEYDYTFQDDWDAVMDSLGGHYHLNVKGKKCYISQKHSFVDHNEALDMLRISGKGESLGFRMFLYEDERKLLRRPTLDYYVAQMETASTGSRLEFMELNPDRYKIYYCIRDRCGFPQFVWDKKEGRFICYWFKETRNILRLIDEDSRNVDHREKLLTREGENGLEVVIRFGKPQSEAGTKTMCEKWMPFGEGWYNPAAVVKETNIIQGNVQRNVRGLTKAMTIPERDDTVTVGNPSMVPLDEEGNYDDMTYNQMAGFNPHEMAIAMIKNDRDKLGLRKSENVPMTVRAKVLLALYEKMPRTKIAPKQAPKSDDGETKSQIILTVPEKEGYEDKGKSRLEADNDDTDTVVNWFNSNKGQKAVLDVGEYIEV